MNAGQAERDAETGSGESDGGLTFGSTTADLTQAVSGSRSDTPAGSGGAGGVGGASLETLGDASVPASGSAGLETQSADSGTPPEPSAAPAPEPSVMSEPVAPPAPSPGTDAGTPVTAMPDAGSAQPAPSSDSGTQPQVTFNGDHCTQIPALLSAPVLDGVLEAGMTLQSVQPLAWSGASSTPNASLRFAIGWYSGGLHFFLEVTDPDLNPAADADPVWYGDGVEIYADDDGVYGASGEYLAGTRQIVVGAPVDLDTPSVRAEIYTPAGKESDWDPSRFVSVGTATGYVVEATIAAADLGATQMTLSAGGQVGFDLGHNVSFEPGTTGYWGNRDGQYFYALLDPLTYTIDDYPWNNGNAFCTPTLLP